MIELLILLALACLVIWAARAIMTAFGIGDPIFTIVQVVLVIIILIKVIHSLGYGGALDL